MIINHLRTYEQDRTTGKLYVNGDRFGSTVEDIGRPPGVKIYAETCIPEGVYRVIISMSGRFKKPMMLLYNQDDFSVDNSGIRFTGIRVHKGVGIEHTSGCVLLLNYEVLQERVADSSERVFWIISRDLN